jgi:ATP-binding cassette subfamily B protein AbcA/BmrA
MLWDKILHLPQCEVDKRQPSALISGVVNDVKTASDVLTMIFSLVSSLYAFTRAVIELFKFNASLAAWMLILIPLAILVFTLVGRTQAAVTRRQYKSLREMTEFFSEHISAAKNVKTQALEDREEREGLQEINKRFKADLFGAFMSVVQTTTYSLYTSFSTVLIAVFGSRLIRENRMEKTGINDFSTYMGKVDQYTAEILTQYPTLRGTQGAMQYVGELMESPREEPEKGTALPEDADVSDIVLKDVCFSYEPGVPVLKNLSCVIPGGKVTAIIGNNGSGKSTLLKLLQGVYAPTGGTITLGGDDVTALAPHDLRRQFGYILQNNPLFSGTVRDNITYGAPDASEEQILTAAKLADALDFINELPNGFDTEVGEGGKLLSGGQRQRVAIARTLLTEPSYLLMDEAGASLDHRSDAAIFRSVREALVGRTIILIAHDMRSVIGADHIIVLNKGELEAVGDHELLLQISPTYRDYLEKQGFVPAGEEA